MMHPRPFGRPMAQAARSTSRIPLRPSLGVWLARSSAEPASGTSIHVVPPRYQTQRCTLQARPFSSQIPPSSKKQDTLTDATASPSPNRDVPNVKTSNVEEVNNAESISNELPSVAESRRSELNRGFSNVMDNLQARVLTASQTLNDITGYSSIEGIKRENETLETKLAAAHARVRTARQAYKTSNTKRANTQREVTTLLARKDTWTPADLERFTELYRTDHVLEGEVSAAQEALTESEADEQSFSQRLNAGILKRYHEEQIWSDRIRRASTWGTWGLMGMNFLLFVVLQFFAEPWRRRRLVKGVVEAEKLVLEEVRAELEAVKLTLANNIDIKTSAPSEEADVLVPGTAPIATASTEPKLSWKEFVTDPAHWKVAAADLGSERRIDLSMKDASTLALQGALAGAALAGSVAMLVMRNH